MIDAEPNIAADLRAPDSASERVYPELDEKHSATRPISFVTVHFSDDLAHNLALSECVRDPRNQLIVVDNRNNLLHATLGAALEHGIAQARHELIALVHEDVLLLPGWQPAAERALAALQAHDPQWAFAAVAGWLADGTPRGHWSDPHGYFDHLHDDAFAEVDRFDEQMILFRREGRISLDTTLPSIHNIGSDLVRSARAGGRRSYVINAPTVHKFADAGGHRIQHRSESPKIMGRTSLTYLADLKCSDVYLERKWSSDFPATEMAPPLDRLSSPIVLLARGGGGSRLLSILAQDAGVFLGDELNPSGDAMPMVAATYGLLLARYRYPSAGLRQIFVDELRRSAESWLDGSEAPIWGYKLPESLLVLDEVAEAFPSARFVHLVRDPLDTCLRRTHMTARYDNQIGQAALLAAYRAQGRKVEDLLCDPPALHMAYTTRHQLEYALDWTHRLPAERILQIRFEDLLENAQVELHRLQDWLRAKGEEMIPVDREPGICAAIDRGRARNPGMVFAPELQREVARVLAPLRRRLGYLA